MNENMEETKAESIAESMEKSMEERFHLNDFRRYAHENRFMEYNNIELTELTKECCILKHVVTENSCNINGSAHGGLMMTMMDIASCVLLRKNGMNNVTNTMTSSFLKQGHGTIYARAEILKQGRRISVVHAWVYNENNDILADATVNLCQID